LNIYNTPQNPGLDNGEGNIDIKYSGVMADHPFQIYMQLMNEDSNPIVYSGTSHLFGASVWIPVDTTDVRLTLEYTSSLATKNIFSFGEYRYGFAYNDYKYVDGMHYRGRSLGFSLDTDSQLLSVQAEYADPLGCDYSLTYHHAEVSAAQNTVSNVVTTAPVRFNMVEGRANLPLLVRGRTVQLDLAGRLQDDQPRPDKGFKASLEASLTVDL
jgi:hypothetical protein